MGLFLIRIIVTVSLYGGLEKLEFSSDQGYHWIMAFYQLERNGKRHTGCVTTGCGIDTVFLSS